MKAWHFVAKTLRDGSPIPADGIWLEHSGPLEMCVSGLHASKDPFDALNYAPGPILCRVDVGGEVIESDDKLVASRRRIINRVDMTDQLCRFARECALDVIHLWDAPPVVRRYLKTGNEAIRGAARAAAWQAATWAADAAAEEAANAAAWAAEEAAVRAGAREAAWDAAWAAAEAAREAAWEATWAADAARAAADAAEAKQRKRFNKMVRDTFKKGT